MTLRVDFDSFAPTIERIFGAKSAVVCCREGKTIVTAADAQKGIVVGCATSKPIEEVRAALKTSGVEVHAGEWSEGGEWCLADGDELPPYVVAVAYKSREAMPGLWVDAFPIEPSPAEVLKALYDEFEMNGELIETTFDEFLRMSHPNVVVVSPDDLARFARVRVRER